MQIGGLFFKGPVGVWPALPSVLLLGRPARLSHILELSESDDVLFSQPGMHLPHQQLFLPSTSLLSFLCVPAVCLTSLYPLDTCLPVVKVPLL